MTRTDGALSRLITWAADHADGQAGRRAVANWSAHDPAFAPFRTVGEVVRAAWSDPTLADELLSRLAALDDGVAVQAALAVLVPRLAGIVRRWARAGVPAADLGDLEAELVLEALAGLRHGPDHPTPGQVVDAAWARVRNI